MLEYLEVFRTQPTGKANNQLMNYFSGGKKTGQTLEMFSSAGDPLGYADKSISGEMITEVFLNVSARTRKGESEGYLKTLSGQFTDKFESLLHLNLNPAAICGSLDNTFKAASKATLTNRDRQKSKELRGGILSVLNEDNQIIAWVCLDDDSLKLLTMQFLLSHM
jgi:hypothetical protein